MAMVDNNRNCIVECEEDENKNKHTKKADDDDDDTPGAHTRSGLKWQSPVMLIDDCPALAGTRRKPHAPADWTPWHEGKGYLPAAVRWRTAEESANKIEWRAVL